MRKHMFSWFARMPLKSKMILFFVILNIVSLALAGVLCFYSASLVLRRNTGEAMLATMEQSVTSIRLFLEDIEDMSIFLLSDLSVQEYLKTNDVNNVERASKMIDSIYSTFYNLGNAKDHIELIGIYKEITNQSLLIGYATHARLDIAGLPWYPEILELDGKAKLFDSAENNLSVAGSSHVFTYARAVNDNLRIDKRLGVMFFTIKESAFYQVIQPRAEKESDLFIMNRSGAILSHRDKGMLLRAVGDAGFLEQTQQGTRGYFEWEVNGASELVAYHAIPGSDWVLVSKTPVHVLNMENRPIALLIPCVVMLSLILTSAVSVRIASTITRPTAKLLKEMQRVSQGNLNSGVDFYYGDEISQLGHGFNAMVYKLRELMEHVRMEEKQKREVELQALQAQINPHFLYNTLETINWLAQEIQADSISDIVCALANFFRISISRGQDLIPIINEIEHIKNYVVIQKFRYADRISIRYSWDRAIELHKIPKLILQPLVENSVYHGLKSDIEQIAIEIECRRKAEAIQITVSDNGTGIDANQIEAMNRRLVEPGHRSDDSGYGIYNVNERIQLYYGKAYGLQYEANEGAGVKAIITIPFCDEGECDDQDSDRG